jgi:hypothetical protein
VEDIKERESDSASESNEEGIDVNLDDDIMIDSDQEEEKVQN